MIDLTEFGRGGMVIQYEDIISMIGFNVAKFFRSKGISEKLDNTSIEDVLLSYINREEYDYSIWMDKEYGIKVNPDELLTSFLTMQPNLLYSYKVFTTSHNEKINSLYIYSNQYSPIAEQATKSYGFDGVKYIHGDIVSFLNEHPNYTYLTSLNENIEKCLTVNSPICLVICEDYLYTSKIVLDKLDQKLKEKGNIILRYTGVISAGIIS